MPFPPPEAAVSTQVPTVDWKRWSLRIGISAIALGVLWLVLSRVIAADRGLDLGDESLYLVAADPPNLEAAWAYPFGWSTRPFFWIVGYDIAAFRTLGAVLLFVASGVLGWNAMLAITDLRRSCPRPRPIVGIAAATGATASLLYYSSMLRAPSYNWVTLCAIVLCLATVLAALRRAVAPSQHDWSWSRGRVAINTVDLLAILTSLVLVVSIPGKPSTAPAMLIATSVVLAVGVGWRCASRWFVVSVALMPIWLAVAVVTRMWPVDFLTVFRLAKEMPYPFAVQTPIAAVQAMVLAPRDVLSAFAGIADRPAELLIAGFALLVVPLAVHRTLLAVRLAGLLMAVVGALAVSGVPIPVLSPVGSPFSWAHAPLTTAALIVLCAALLAGLRMPSDAPIEVARDRRTRIVVVAVIAASPLVFSFGSSFGPYPQAAVASGLVFLAAGLSVARPAASRARTVLAIAVLITTLFFSVAAIASGWRYPLRQWPIEVRTPPIADQVVPTTVGSHGAVLDLDPVLAAKLADLREQAEVAGWQDGMPLVDLSYLTTPGASYSLGARAPDSLMLTVIVVGFGENYREITRFHLTEPYLGFPFHDSWILTTKSSMLEPAVQAEVDYTLSKLSEAADRPFPGGYSCVTAGDWVLWRPSTTLNLPEVHCDLA